jgi:serine/threonine protein kinase
LALHRRVLGLDSKALILGCCDEVCVLVSAGRAFGVPKQFAGQLQHPGIVPIHELGKLADGLSYFTMKLVKGQTLSRLLALGTTSEADRARILGIFEQVCQTVAYVHAHGVIHRDLKPSNVMVGNFGEVQVMDWGLAKVLRGGGEAEDPTRRPETPPPVLDCSEDGECSESYDVRRIMIMSRIMIMTKTRTMTTTTTKSMTMTMTRIGRRIADDFGDCRSYEGMVRR